MKTTLVDKYNYDKAMENLRKAHYKVTMDLKFLEAAEYDLFGDFIKFEDEIPLTPIQQTIMWDNQ